MDAETEGTEERLRSFQEQLRWESRVLERLIYKNKNQHRRCSYFQCLLKVRRDLRLLELAKLDQILDSCFHVVSGKKPRHKLHLLECLKWKMSDSGTPNFMERLLGAARLLSQMVEPIVKAAIEVSTLLARSFFMGFSLTVLALLSRIRVLVQQVSNNFVMVLRCHRDVLVREQLIALLRSQFMEILLDVVKVFNKVSIISQEKQSIKIAEKGVEIFREYYPSGKVFITLDCAWSTDKYILFEQKHETTGKGEDDHLGASSNISAPRYKSIESFLGDDAAVVEEVGEDGTGVAGCPGRIIGEDNWPNGLTLETEHVDGIEVGVGQGDCPVPKETADQTLSAHQISNLSSSPSSIPSSRDTKLDVVSAKRPGPSRPAFVSVKRRATSPSKPENLQVTQIPKEAGEQDSFFNLLTGGSLNHSLF